jgi:hypothetical protein
VDRDESPFAGVPEPGIGPRPTPVTYEQQVASVGAFAVGLQDRPRWIRFAVRTVVGLFLLLFLVAIAVTIFG